MSAQRPAITLCRMCWHPATEHGRERDLYDSDSRREVCLMCPGYWEPGYPHGAAWHRYRGAPEPAS